MPCKGVNKVVHCQAGFTTTQLYILKVFIFVIFARFLLWCEQRTETKRLLSPFYNFPFLPHKLGGGVVESLRKSVLVSVTLSDQVTNLNVNNASRTDKCHPGMGFSSATLVFLTHSQSMSHPLQHPLHLPRKEAQQVPNSWAGLGNTSLLPFLFCTG